MGIGWFKPSDHGEWFPHLLDIATCLQKVDLFFASKIDSPCVLDA